MSVTIKTFVGIDEVGRGPLAGPVTICACTVALGFDSAHFDGIKDSKQLSPQKREEWFLKLSALRSKGELDFAYASVPADEIDAFGISKAIEKAIHVSLDALRLAPESTEILLDGSLKAPTKFTTQKTIIKGDEKIPLISAASIVAKVMRDRYMAEQALLYPEYGLDSHKGYGTAAHLAAIKKHGATPLHRKSFLKNILPKRGFTLIELLVVISIISLLSSVVLSSLNSARDKARDAHRVETLLSIRNALLLYASDNNGSFPAYGRSCLGVATGGTCWPSYNTSSGSGIPGNTALNTALAPYISKVPLDPDPTRGFGDAYIYFQGAGDVHCNGAETVWGGTWLAWQPSKISPTSDSFCKPGTTACCSGLGCSSTAFCLLQIN